MALVSPDLAAARALARECLNSVPSPPLHVPGWAWRWFAGRLPLPLWSEREAFADEWGQVAHAREGEGGVVVVYSRPSGVTTSWHPSRDEALDAMSEIIRRDGATWPDGTTVCLSA